MTQTYVFHSCFVLETDKSILIFDYWLDLNGIVPPFLKKDKLSVILSDIPLGSCLSGARRTC